VLVLLAIIGYANAKFAFPVPSYYAVEKAFRNVKANIKWDPTNLLTDLAGPLAMCERTTDWMTAGKKTAVQAETVWNATRIDPVFFPQRDAYVPYLMILTATGADARSVANDINSGLQNLSRTNFQGAPFTELNSDLQSSIRFGCSVEPQCPGTGKTIIVCLFGLTTELPDDFVQGFNQTWKAHSHDPYTGIAKATMPDGMELPGYIYTEDEEVVIQAIGNDLCDKHAYDPNGFVTAVRNYWKNPQPPMIHSMGASKNIGWYLATIAHPNATGSEFITTRADGTVPIQFTRGVLGKLFGSAPERNAVMAKSQPIDLNSGGCVIAVCPGRPLPRGGTAGGKLTTKGNYCVLGCMLFKTDEVQVE